MREERANIHTQNCAVCHTSARLIEAEHNPLKNLSSSATLNAQSTATELGWDPYMHRNVPTATLLAPQPKEREKKLGRRRTPCQKRNRFIFYMYTYATHRNPLSLVLGVKPTWMVVGGLFCARAYVDCSQRGCGTNSTS